ncbi:MAG: DNA translocase FtsK [Polyangiaceae bacterium]|nr:DNA translocase FtsK [Polyangiaceae bacterium]
MGSRPFSRAVNESEAACEPDRDAVPPRLPLVVRRGREVGALLFFALAAFLALALVSFRGAPYDPGLGGADFVGPVGATIARVLVQGFGVVAWLGVVELSLLGLPWLRGGELPALGLRIAGDLVIGVVLAALAQVLAPEAHVFGEYSSGGNVGLLFGELMRGLFSTLGSFLVGATVIGLILVGRASFSFIAWCTRLAALARVVDRWLRGTAGRVAGAWAEAWRIRREQHGEVEAPAPSIHRDLSDEAILARLGSDEEGDWIPPLESPGALPLAVSDALRGNGFVFEADPTKEPPLASATPEWALGSGSWGPASDASLLVASSVGSPLALSVDPDPFNVEATGALLSSAEAGEVADPPSVAKKPRKERARREVGPRIVDTSPEQKVDRANRRAERRDGFQMPSPSLLEQSPDEIQRDDEDRLKENARLLEKTLADFGVSARVTDIRPGPTVTTYEVKPAAGTKVSKVVGLADDLALGLSRKVRINPHPEKGCIGFELPNDHRPRVFLRDLVEHRGFSDLAGTEPLPMVLGRDPVGKPFYADLTAMTHVIVAGATGAGKSVGINVMLASLLFSRTPDELRLLMIDPKVVELAPFDGIPHMLLPVVTDMKQAAAALRWAVDEMERRYQLFADAGTKNVRTYNAWVDRVVRGEIPAPDVERLNALTAEGAVVSVSAAKDGGDGVNLPGRLPYIVVVVDEFADLMMQQGKDVEVSVARLAQKARAAGIHVILATQRPSVDVITGMIKANFPSRIAFRVAQKVDSRTILDEQGAEHLLGKGDMLVKMNGRTDMLRVQCPFISEEEVAALTDFLRSQGTPQYHDAILRVADEDDAADGPADLTDARYDEAVQVVAETQRCSTSWLQRKMGIGYNRAAKIVETMERQGVVGPANGVKDREVFVAPQ